MATASYIGVYSSLTGAKRLGGGARKRYWFVWDDLFGGYIIQPLDAAYKPTGDPFGISAEEFTQNFKIEESILVTPIVRLEVADRSGRTPVGQDIPKKPAKPESKREVRQRQEAAVALDRTLREEFATAMKRLQRGEKTLAINAFEHLAKHKKGIVPAHKHTFTYFAVSLRKSHLPAMAFKFYQRALELSPEDSNAYFNMARIMFDLGNYDGTKKHLTQALNLDVGFVEAQKFLDYLDSHRLTNARKSGKP